MDIKTSGMLVNPKDYPGVTFGEGVVIYGKVEIGTGTYIGDYTILGIPSIDHIQESEPLSKTVIGKHSIVGPFCVINNGVKIDSGVEIEEHCKIGWGSKIGSGTLLRYRTQIHWNVTVGKRCIIGGFCCDCSVVGDEVVMFGNLIHKYQDPLNRSFKNPIFLWKTKGGKQPSPNIGKQSIIGFNALVIGGVKILPRSYIFANAIVAKNVNRNNIVKQNKCYSVSEWKKLKESTYEKKS